MRPWVPPISVVQSQDAPHQELTDSEQVAPSTWEVLLDVSQKQYLCVYVTPNFVFMSLCMTCAHPRGTTISIDGPGYIQLRVLVTWMWVKAGLSPQKNRRRDNKKRSVVSLRVKPRYPGTPRKNELCVLRKCQCQDMVLVGKKLKS